MKIPELIIFTVVLCHKRIHSFWDEGTSTRSSKLSEEMGPRVSFFRWMNTDWVDNSWDALWKGEFLAWKKDFMYGSYLLTHYTWHYRYKMFITCVAGISIDLLPITTAVILNHRTLITAANPLERYRNRMTDLRVWALGNAGASYTPYRYRVWRFRRLLPRSLNPEHQLGPYGTYTARHDLVIIHTWDQMYIRPGGSSNSWYAIATRAMLADKTAKIMKPLNPEGPPDNTIVVGSGFVNYKHIKENWQIYYLPLRKNDVKNCEMYIPKWWGKHICIVNWMTTAGLQSGGGLFSNYEVFGIGAFEIRYNEDRIYVFTDLRYYYDWIMAYANITVGEYYDYAYQQWGVPYTYFNFNYGPSQKFHPSYYTRNDFYYLGKLGK